MTSEVPMLPRLETYTAGELEAASEANPAIDRYLRLLQRPLNSDPLTLLRRERHEAWLACALATYHRRAPPRDVCLHWTQAAESLIAKAWAISGADRLQMVLLALGKLGARELNLSSDIDVVLVSRHPADGSVLKALREFRAALAEVTDFGFCLRVDMDIRPGGRLGPHVSSLSQFEDYYWNHGATWERLALVRLRPLVGDEALKADVRTIADRFVYRRFLDFTVFEDLKELRSMIRGRHEASEAGALNLKYERGAIRDIELFVHALQVLHGGKNQDLRTPNTQDALDRISRHGLLPASDVELLGRSYWRLRELENRVQGADDRQTYLWRATAPEIAELKRELEPIDSLVSSLLGRAGVAPTTLPPDMESQQEWLREKGFSAASIETTWKELMDLTVHSRTSQRDEEARRRFVHLFVTALAATRWDKDLGLRLLVDFVRATRAKATFFTLLIHEPRLIRDLALLFGTSPYLGGILASRPELIDSYLYRAQDLVPDDLDALLEQLTERRLLTEIIGANHFLSHRDVEPLLESLTATADEIGTLLLRKLDRLYGPSGVKILCLGKWGGRELGLRSDLDFVFCTEKPPTEADHKVAKRFISRLTDQHKGGQIYTVDLRLRPTGKAGPLLVTEERLRDYLDTEAAAWERQAYLRARPLADFSFSPAATAARRGLSKDDVKALRDIRVQLTAQKASSGIDLKFAPGGLVAIEFAVQTALLQKKIAPEYPSTSRMIQTLATHDSKWQRAAAALTSRLLELRRLEQMHQLMTHNSGGALQPGTDGFQRLAQFFDLSPEDLMEHVQGLLEANRDALKDLDPINSPG